MTGEKETYSDSARVCRDEAESDGGRFPVMTGGVVREPGDKRRCRAVYCADSKEERGVPNRHGHRFEKHNVADESEHRHEDGAEAATPIAIGPPGVEHGQEERQNEWRDCEKLRADRRITECLDDCSAIRRLLAAV